VGSRREANEHVLFQDFSSFYDYAVAFKKRGTTERLRVHVPGSFSLANVEREKISALGVELI
jgi:hypothetical protein